MSPKLDRVLLHVYERNHWNHGLLDIANYLRGTGAQVDIINVFAYPLRLSRTFRGKSDRFVPFVQSWMKKKLAPVDHVFMWNGEGRQTKVIRAACREMGVPCTIVEVGYFPQSKFYVIDPQGINGSASLMHDSLDWIQEVHHKKLADIRESHLRGRKWKGGGGYILIPLQLADDTNIVNNSDFTTMTQFIRHCETTFADKKLIFKRHPSDKEEYQSAHPIRVDGDFLDLAVNADSVYGINSTCLLESLLLGAPTEAIGKGFANAHKHQPEKLLAALADKQIPVGEKDISYWLEKYSAIGDVVAMKLSDYQYLLYKWKAHREGLPQPLWRKDDAWRRHQRALISPRGRFLYIPIQKVANTSIKHAMVEFETGKPLPGSRRIHRTENLRRAGLYFVSLDSAEQFPGYRFTMVRHPMTRMVSCYRDKTQLSLHTSLRDLAHSKKA